MSAGKTGSAPLLPDQYEVLLEGVRATAEESIPRNATVLVVTRGDDELLRLGPRRALHFPQDDLGGYLGYHPHDSESAISMLEGMRARGAQYLVLPSSSFWWLDHYEEFNQHLQDRYAAIADKDECMVFELASGFEPRRPVGNDALEDLLAALLPPDADVAILRRGNDLPAQLAATDAEFAVVPASIRETTGERVEGWKLVTSQQYIGDVWEKLAVGTANSSLLQRARTLLRI